MLPALSCTNTDLFMFFAWGKCLHFAAEVWKKFRFSCLVISKLLCGAQLLWFQFFPPRGPFCRNLGLFRGLVSVGGWCCLLVERMHELQLLQMTHVSQLIRATVVLHTSDYLCL